MIYIVNRKLGTTAAKVKIAGIETLTVFFILPQLYRWFTVIEKNPTQASIILNKL